MRRGGAPARFAGCLLVAVWVLSRAAADADETSGKAGTPVPEHAPSPGTSGKAIAATPRFEGQDEPADEEAAALARSLAAEVIRLRDEAERLRLERDEWMRRAAEGRQAEDLLAIAGDELPPAQPDASVVSPSGWTVAAADETRGLVALGGGWREGLRPGMAVAIVRGDELIARARVVQVRERLTGARVETIAGGRFPAAGDRAVPWRPARK